MIEHPKPPIAGSLAAPRAEGYHDPEVIRMSHLVKLWPSVEGHMPTCGRACFSPLFPVFSSD